MVGLLCEKISSAIEKCADAGKFAIPFSGGLDSSIIAWVLRKNREAMLVSVGVSGSQDLEWSLKYSKEWGMKAEFDILGENKIIQTYEKLKLMGHDFLTCGILLPFYVACEVAKEKKCKKIISGAGAEEVFIGYRKFVQRATQGEEVSRIRKDAIEYWHSQNGDGRKIKEVAGLFGLDVEFPFMDEEVVNAACSIDGKRHIPGNEGLNKPVLREVALELGLPKEIALRPKKAMQYGSGVHKKLLKLKKEGKIS